MLSLFARVSFTTRTGVAPTVRRSFSTCRAWRRDLPSTPVENDGPLAGIRVLDLTRVLGKSTSLDYGEMDTDESVAGPYCTMMLGDLG